MLPQYFTITFNVIKSGLATGFDLQSRFKLNWMRVDSVDLIKT
jgi:hypothetical protein